MSEFETPVDATPLLEKGPLPWQDIQWQALVSQLRAGRLPHALLFTGMHGLGKNHFAENFAQALLCTTSQANGQACNLCRSCLLYLAGTHPDYLQLRPSEEGKAILVDQVRDMNATMALKSHYTGYKLVLISPADQLNTAAANSLLKTLEEPPAQSLLIMITSKPSALLPTVRSRCQVVTFTRPANSLARAWLAARIKAHHDPAQLLALANGAPLAALDMSLDDRLARRKAAFDDFSKLTQRQANPLAIAAIWLERGAVEPLYWMLDWAMDMIRLHSVLQPLYLANADSRQQLQALSAQISLACLYAHLDCVTEALRLLNSSINVQLLLEDVLVSWSNSLPDRRNC